MSYDPNAATFRDIYGPAVANIYILGCSSRVAVYLPLSDVSTTDDSRHTISNKQGSLFYVQVVPRAA
jgi:hypothetical protein